ncbi:MAG: transposase [bacterium]
MKNITKTFVGVDVSKKYLDICFYPSSKKVRIENTKNGLNILLKQLMDYDVVKITLEASGGYERLAIFILGERYKVYLVNPKRIRDFRFAQGRAAKTDAIDALLIARFSANECSENIEPINTRNIELNDLFIRKQELKFIRSSEKNRFEKKMNMKIKMEITKHVKYLDRQIEKLDKEITNIIKANNTLKNKKEILESMPGIGNETAQGIIASLPEIGSVDSKKISSLVGLAPQTNESGQFVGRARINHGRNQPRKLLYMAALSAIRCNPRLKEFYDRLREKGKAFKVAIVAIMRKIIVILNIMLMKNKKWKLMELNRKCCISR